jgi:hypothetical protein
MRIIDGAEVDRRLAWPVGHAKRLAKRGTLPHLVLPDGSIRFRWDDIKPLIVERLSREAGVSTGKTIEDRIELTPPDLGGNDDA